MSTGEDLRHLVHAAQGLREDLHSRHALPSLQVLQVALFAQHIVRAGG
jgi:hypothetical protein